jgi:hypothetical protein
MGRFRRARQLGSGDLEDEIVAFVFGSGVCRPGLAFSGRERIPALN